MADRGIKLTVQGFKAFNAELEKFLDISVNVSSKLDRMANAFDKLGDKLVASKITDNINKLSASFKSFENIDVTGKKFFNVISDLNIKSRALMSLTNNLSTIKFDNFRNSVKDLNVAMRSLSVDKISEKLSKFKNFETSMKSFISFFKKIDKTVSEFNGITSPDKIKGFSSGISIFMNFLTMFEKFQFVKNLNIKDLDSVVIDASKVLKTIGEFFTDKNFLANKNFNINQTETLFKAVNIFNLTIEKLLQTYSEISKLSNFNIDIEGFKKTFSTFSEITGFIFGDNKYNKITGGFGDFFQTIKNAKNKADSVDVSGSDKLSSVLKKSFEFVKELSVPLSQSDLLSRRLSNINSGNFLELPKIANSIFEFMTSFSNLSNVNIDENKIKENIDKLSIFINMVGERNVFDKLTKAYSDINENLSNIKSNGLPPTKINNIKNIFSFLPIIGKNIVDSIAPKTLMERFNNINVTSLENMSKFAKSIGEILPVFSNLSNVNIDTEKITKTLNDFNKIITVFTGENIIDRFKKISFDGSSLSNMGKTFGVFFDTIVNKVFPRNIISRFSGFSLTDISKFTESLSAIEKFVRTFKRFEDLPNIDEASIKQLEKTLVSISQIFTNKTFLDLFYGQMSKRPSFGFIEAFSKSVVQKLFGLPSIIERFGSFDESSILGLVRFSRSMIHLTNALKELNDATINQNTIEKNLEIINKVAKSILNSSIFNNSSIVNRVKNFFGLGTNIQKTFLNFKEFSTGLKNVSEAFSIISKLKIDDEKIASFLSNLKMIYSGIKGISPNNDFKNVGALSNTFSKMLSNLSMKSTSKDMEKAGKDAAKSFTKGAKNEWQIKSPSRVFISLGKNIVDGLKIGLSSIYLVLKNFTSFVFKSFKNIVSSVFTNIKNESNKLNNRFSSIFDNIRKGFNSISDFAFRFNNILGMLTNVNGGNFIGSAVSFESQMADVFKTVDMSGLGSEQAELFMKGFIDDIEYLATNKTSTVSGMENAFTQLSSIAVQAGSAGIARENLVSFIETIGQLTQATDLSSDTAGMSLAGIATIANTTEYDRIGSTLVDLGNKFNATESQITEFAERLVGIKAGTNLTLPNILALSSAMASVRINAEAGGTSMTEFVTEITKAVSTGKNLEQYAKIAGWSAEQFTQGWRGEPISILNELVEGFGKMTSEEQVRALEKLGLDGVRVSDMIRRLSSSQGLLYNSINEANDAWSENIALTEEAQKRNETARASIERIKNSLFLTGKTLGEFFLPTINTLSDVIVNLNIGFSNLLKDLKPLITYIMPQLSKFVGYMILGLTSAFSITALLTNSFYLLFKSASLTFGIFFKFFKFIASPFNILTGFLVFKVLPDILNKINKEGKKTLEVFSDLFRSFFKFLSSSYELVKSFTSLVGSILNFRKTTDELQQSPFLNFLTRVKENFDFITDSINNVISKINFFRDLINTTSSLLPNNSPQTLFQDYKIEQGDTLWELSRQFNIPIEDLISSNNIENASLIITGATLKIPIVATDAQGNPIEQTSDIINSNNPFTKLEQMQNTDIFKTMFGDDSGALDRAKQTLMIIQENITLAKDSGRDFVLGFKELASGNITDGLNRFKDGVAGITSSLLGVFGGTNFQATPNVGEEEGLIGKRLATRTTITENPFLANIRNYLLELRTMDLTESAQALSDTFSRLFDQAFVLFKQSDFVTSFKNGINDIFNNNQLENIGIETKGTALQRGLELGFDAIISGALVSVVGLPGYFIVSLTNAIENDFLGLRSQLEKSNIGNIIISSFDFIGELIDNAFNSIISFANGKQRPEELGLSSRFAVKDDNSLMSRIDGFFKPITDFLKNINSVDFEGVRTGIGNLFSTIGQIASGGLEGFSTFINSVSDALKVFFDYLGTEEGKKNIEVIGTSLSNFFNGILSFGGKSIETLITFSQNILPSISDLFSSISNFFTSMVDKDIKGMGNAFSQFISGIVNSLASIVPATLDLFINFIEVLSGKNLPDSNFFLTNAITQATILVNQFKEILLNAELAAAVLNSDTEAQDRIKATQAAGGFQNMYLQRYTNNRETNFDPNETLRYRNLVAPLSRMLTNDTFKQEFFNFSGVAREAFIESLNNSLTSGSSTFNELLPFYEGVFGLNDPNLLFKAIFGNFNVEEQKEIIRTNIIEPLSGLFQSDTFLDGEAMNKGIFSSIPSFFQNLGLIQKPDDPLSNSNPFQEAANVQISKLQNYAKSLLNDLGIFDESEIGYIAGNISTAISDETANKLDMSKFNNELIKQVKDGLGIKSPSTVFMEIGEYSIDGYMEGLLNRKEILSFTFDDVIISKIKEIEEQTRTSLSNSLMYFTLFSLSIGLVTLPLMITMDIITNKFANFDNTVINLVKNINSLGSALAVFGLVRFTPVPIFQQVQKVEGRKFGGELNAGQTYQVLEDNLPYELYKTDSGKTYFIPNQNGVMKSPMGNGNYGVGEMGNGYYYNNVEQVSYNIPITFENVPSDTSPANLQKISKTIGDNIKKQLNGNGTKLQEKLRRRGYR